MAQEQNQNILSLDGEIFVSELRTETGFQSAHDDFLGSTFSFASSPGTFEDQLEVRTGLSGVLRKSLNEICDSCWWLIFLWLGFDGSSR